MQSLKNLSAQCLIMADPDTVLVSNEAIPQREVVIRVELHCQFC